ncbi:MAG: DUF3853 family protein [Bacteroidetes bacterium]|nr:DUF3853 family protein [Bacteroidota bacterium]
MANKEERHIDNSNTDSNTLIKLSGRILSYLRELEAKIELQEDLLLELRKNQSTQNTTKQFEPIRGIHGLANFLGVSPVTAQKLKNSGKIPFAQFERVVLFDPKRVLDALEDINKPKKN